MKFSESIPLSIFILLIFTTFMAIAGIRAFSRLAPDIERINKSNTQSLYLLDKMLTAEVSGDIKSFEENFNQQKNNITEPMEAEKIAAIEAVYKKAFNGDIKYKKILIVNLADLTEINRYAMLNAAKNAKQLSVVGIWVIVFMITIIWTMGAIVLINLKKTIINPLHELEDVLDKVSKGNKFRRCPTIAPTSKFQKIYDKVNQLLDK